ncbi:MAG: hypothetical protein CVT66_08890 [Actinobacteria bacterium HGW-Actinobacteria-6]|nr:MAG: hypothetical protein CVT66_08890 [Actinobacteria bacterium HGW-Actinobacteria-6]
MGDKSGDKSEGYRTDRDILGPPNRQLSCTHPEIGVHVLPKTAPLAAATEAGITKLATASATS